MQIHGNGGSYFHVDHYLSAETQRSVNGGELASQALERLHGRIPRLTERRAAESNFIKRIMQTQSYGYHLVHVIEVLYFVQHATDLFIFLVEFQFF